MAAEAGRQLLAAGHKVTLLCLVEHSINQAFDGLVAHYLAQRNRLSPYYRFDHPEIGWQKLFPGKTAVTVFPWEHDEFTREENIERTASQLAADIEYARNNQQASSPECGLQVLRPADYRSKLRIRAPKSCEPGQNLPAVVEFRNLSDVTWQPSPASGIAIYASWVNYRGGVILNQRIGELEQALGPGESLRMERQLQAPGNSGRWRLEVGLVDEGITLFGDLGYGMARRRIYVYRPGELGQRLRRRLLNAVRISS